GIIRVGFIIFVQGDDYRAQAEAGQLYDEIIPANRGTIYDANMNPLVRSSSAWILIVDPASIYSKFKVYNEKIKGTDEVDTSRADAEREKYYEYLSEGIAKILGEKKKDIKEMLTKKDSYYVRIKKDIDATTRLALDELFGTRYVYAYTKKKHKEVDIETSKFFRYENDTQRIYPDNHFASSVIGVINNEGDGITGVEMKYNDVLKGENGRRVTAKDASNNAIDSSYETVFDASEGNGVVLTIDSNIQLYLENALSQALKNTGAKGVYGVVMDVKTGAVLAMSDKPDFDLNDPYTLLDESAIKKLNQYKDTDEYKQMRTNALYDQWNNDCVTNTFEPGSTFKIFTAAAALEEGVANLKTTYTCTGGYEVVKGTTIHCANTNGHGTQTFTQGLMNSCNPFFINVGQKLGVETYYKYFEAFGFTERTGIDVTGEAYPVYHAKSKMSIVDLASTSFGQSVRLSPIQMITAGCAIANGGKLMQPYVVDSVVDKDGNIVSKTEPVVKRQVISEDTAKTVRQMMEAVVEGGTGKNAYIPGYRVAGKTATSEKLDSKEESEQMKYVASFMCFAPANDPEVAILVGVDEPPGEYRGGGVLAAPIAREVMESTLKYLNVEPQYTAKELASVSKTAPNLVGESVSKAKVSAASLGFTVKVIGSGESVTSQVPAAGQSIPDNGVIIVYTDKDSKAEVVKMPSFIGMSASQANQKAHDVGINLIISGPASEASAVAYNQSVAKDTEVQKGSSVTVYFHSTTKTVD
ncbi:MAG: penicillin-binding transpeptidase domain-containing protein, partial [Ruminococcus sp.]|nr:penicillin-binding transpeptidase domain-containing protein [Ruminococcus sp.]